jgi:hypothetical protein
LLLLGDRGVPRRCAIVSDLFGMGSTEIVTHGFEGDAGDRVGVRVVHFSKDSTGSLVGHGDGGVGGCSGFTESSDNRGRVTSDDSMKICSETQRGNPNRRNI